MPDDRDVFAALTALVLERRAGLEDLERFRELLRTHPEFIEIYRRQIMLATLLPALSLWEAKDAEGSAARTTDAAPQPVRRGTAFWWLTLAAAAVALFVAAAVIWHGIPRATCPVSCLPSLAVPVTVVTGADSLELPSTLPGTVRLASGSATVRLTSGVELFLIAPLEMEVCDAMQVQVAAGSLLADVPPHAAGFTVRTPQLEVWDLGTVFSVAVSNSVSDVFVFQGSVQVTEADGGPVDLCEAGEGVRALANDWWPHKVTADWPEARKWFGAVAGRQKALRDPAAALAVADRIATQWGERWLPTIMPPPPPPVPGLSGKLAVGSGQLAVGSKQLAISNMQSAIGSGQLAVGSKQLAVGSGQPKDSSKDEGRGLLAVGQETVTTAPARESAPEVKQEETEMRGLTNTVAAVTVAVTMGTGAVYAVPQVANVRMQQRPGTRVVDVWYNLDKAAIITLGIETNDVPIPDSAVTRLSGDVCKVVQPDDDLHIVWDAGADWPENVTENARARVTAWSTNAPPLYCAVDVAGGTSAETYPVYYYLSAEAVPNGITNDLYKTTRILMRKVSATGAGGFKMGSPDNESYRESAREDWHDVVLTKAFYAGVYQITQSQWYQVMGSWPSKWNNNDYKLTRPVETVSWNDVRGGEWPGDPAGSGQSDAGTFIAKLIARTAISGLDLPTDAQWEYACRAGRAGSLHDGTANLTNTSSDARLDLLGRYQYNGGKINGTTEPAADCTTANATAAVGSYTPNAWGLYDMHGNVWEWCLDWYVEKLGTDLVEDPVGADSTAHRVMRGGGLASDASNCRSAYRRGFSPSTRNSAVGFRLFRTLP